MPRDGSGIYHRPVGTDAVTDTTIESTKYNSNVADVEQDLNTPRPLVAGGSGATSADGALDNLSAEKFKQVVTNWDSTVWRAGSFYAAAASGISPIGIVPPTTAHAFAGIAYYANATDFVCEAIDLNDPANPAKYIRTMTAGVWGPWANISSSSAAALVSEYTFDSGITFPPGSGQVRFNNAIQGSTTEVFLSHLTAMNADNSGLIGFAIRSGYDFFIQDKDEATKWKMFTAAADPVLSGGDYRVTAVFKSGGADLASGQRILIGANAGAAVRYDIAQTLTVPQQTQARNNILAVARSGDTMTGPLTVGGAVTSTGGAFVGTVANTILSAAGSGAVFLRPNGVGNSAGQAVLDGNGLLITNEFRSSSGVFSATGVNAIVAPSAAGGVFLRPNGAASSAGQATVDSGGNAIFTGNVNSPNHTLVNGANGGWQCKAGDNNTAIATYFNFYSTGANLLAYINNTFIGTVTVTSDYRIKKDVIDLPGMWDTVKALRPIKYTQAEYTPIAETERAKTVGTPFVPADNIERWGFIAHELQATLTASAATSYKDAPDAIQSPNPFTIIAALTKALQEAMTRIEALETKAAQ